MNVRFVTCFTLLVAAVCAAPSVPAAAPFVEPVDEPLPPGATLRLGTARLRHPIRIHSLALSDDGNTLATADDEGRVRVWHLPTGRLLTALPPQVARNIALSTDGRTLATAERDGNGDQFVKVWHARTGKELHKIKGLSAQAVAFSQDGKTLAGTDEKGRIALCNVATGQIERSLGKIKPLLRTKIVFSRDGKSLACVDRAFGVKRNYTIGVWDVTNGLERSRLVDDSDEPVTSLAFSADGDLLAAAMAEQVRIWEVEKGRVHETLKEAKDSVAFDASGALIATGGTLAVWNTRGEKTVRVLNFRASVRALAMTLDGSRLVTLSDDENRVRVWDVKKRTEIRLDADGHLGEVRGVAWSRDGKQIATGSGGDRTVRLWNGTTGEHAHTLHVSDRYTEPRRWHEVPMLAFLPDRRTLATPGERFSLYNFASTPLPVGRPMAHTHDARRFALVNDRNEVELQTDGGHVIDRFYAARGQRTTSFESLAFSPDGRLLAIGNVGEVENNRKVPDTVQLWDVEAGKFVRGLRPEKKAPNNVLFSPDGRVLATAMRGERLQLFDVVRGRELAELKGQENEDVSFRPMAFSPDGTLLATSGKEDGIVIWETASGKVVRLLEGHDGGTRSLAFSPDGKRLLSGGADTTALTWEVVPNSGTVERDAWTKDTPAKLWDDLAKDPPTAYPALWSLLANPRPAIALLEKQLHSEKEVDPQRLERLLSQLGDDDFDVRQKADKELEQLGERVEGALRKTLQTTKIPEARKRLVALLARLDVPLSADQLRDGRAIQALERIGSPEAEALLEVLARGGNGRKTLTAELALERLDAARTGDAPVVRRADRPRPETLGSTPRKLGAHKGQVRAIAFAADGKTAFTAGNDGKVRHWDVTSGKELSTLDAHSGGVFALALSQDGKHLATAGADDKVRLWQLPGNKPLLTVPGHKGGAYAVAISPDASLIASGGKDGMMRLWQSDGGKEVKVIFVTLGTVRSVAFTSDGGRLIVGATGGWGEKVNGKLVTLHYPDEVRIWSAKTHKQQDDRIDQRGHDAWLSGDGKWALVTRLRTEITIPDLGDPFLGYAAEVRLVNANTGRLRLELSGRALAVLSPNGRFALTAMGNDYAVDGEGSPVRRLEKQTQLWETISGDEVLRIPGEVTMAAVSPDCRRALLAEANGTLLVADLEPRNLGVVKADAQAFAVLWDQLDHDGTTAYRAGWRLAKWGDDAVPLLRARMGPAPADDPALRRLISGLDAERHVVRRDCSVALAERGAEAAPALKAVLKKATSSTLRRHVEQILDLPGVARLPNDLRLGRVDWVLEVISTAEAAKARRELAEWRK